MTFIPERRNLRAYSYNAHSQNTRMRAVPVIGWHLHGQNVRKHYASSEHLPYAVPVVCADGKALEVIDTENPDFLGVSFSDADFKRFLSSATSRFERENEARLKHLEAEEAARIAEATKRAIEEREARAVEAKAEADAKALRDKRADILSNAENTIAAAAELTEPNAQRSAEKS
ncbi:hypothetical protein [Streptomyces sp. NPDC056670]|uniref:hypothetical protein n=1 Tax=Streptomyces sp. NPDC056670 TaxID=3345904 RepID=UPI0036B29812